MPETIKAVMESKAVSRTRMLRNNQARGAVLREEITKLKNDNRANGTSTG